MAKTEGVDQAAATLSGRVGADVGVSKPFAVEQFEENVFAALIGDWDPMHNDPSWKFDARWHETIVLGYHALSFAERFLREAGVGDGKTVGLGRVRFVAPLPVGQPATCAVRLDALHEDGGRRAHTTLTVSRRDTGSPTMIAQHVAWLGDGDAFAGRESDGPPIAEIPPGTPIDDQGVHDQAFYQRVEARQGQWLGSTPWTTVDTRSANTFRVLVGESIAANHPSDLGAPMLVHPLHLLALRSYFMPQVGLPVLSDRHMAAFNYGLDDARWFAGVPANSRLRDHVQLVDVHEKQPGRWLVKTRHVVEVEGRPRAALTADCLSLFALVVQE